MEAHAVDDEKRRFSVDEVFGMVTAGVLSPDERLELIEGELCKVSPQGAGHGAATAELHRRLQQVYGDRAHVRSQTTLRLGAHDLPEPDLAVVLGQPYAYADRHPGAADLCLVVEIAVTSQARDRRKLERYAHFGVPVCWILDLKGRRLQVYADPRDGAYRSARTVAEPDTVPLPGTDKVWVLADVLPPA